MTAPSRLRVAVAQTEGRLGDLEHNLAWHLEFIEEARARQAKLLLFPELSLTGYDLGESVPDLALTPDSPILAKVAQAARDIDVVFGYVEEGPGARFYNASALVRDGQLRFSHRKVNLPTYGRLEEGKLYSASQAIETCPIQGPWEAGVLICADLWNPALVHLAMLRGATVLLAPISSALGAVSGGFSNPQGWDLTLRFYAMMYGTPILMANRTGLEGQIRFWGGSRILDPHGQSLSEVPDGATGLACAELDYDDLRRARFNLPTLRDSDPPLILRELRRLQDDAGRDPRRAR
jgi:predicted amidohydrolase